jgi:hypothetical protein
MMPVFSASVASRAVPGVSRAGLLVLLLITAPGWAQQTPDSDVTETGEAVALDTGPEDGVEAGADLPEEVPVAGPGESAAAEPETVVPPDQYRASEQISDDLSVSFPVDI